MEDPTQWTIESLGVAFDEYLRSVRGAQPETRRAYGRYARQFLDTVFGDGRALALDAIAPADVVLFIEDKSRRLRPGSVKMIAAALRGFFRFLGILGVGDPRLADAVPTVARWRLSTLPCFLDEEQEARLHDSFDTATAIGRRDRAIVLCLSALGLRAAELAELRLEDIDWRAGSLSVRSRKTRRGGVLPLLRAVGLAVVAYLRNDRPQTTERRIFLTQYGARALSARAVRDVVRAALRRAGIEGLARTGSHTLRHTLATRMIRHGAALVEIADVLGHRSLDTTAIYAKVDLPSLAQVALPWPDATS
jgi:site-specific recombinase XerD